MFTPEFVAGLPLGIGCPSDFVSLYIVLITSIIRRIKIGGTFSRPFSPTNGVGQGCSISLLVTNAFVTVYFNVLDRSYSSLALGALIDDRNIRHSSVDVVLSVARDTADFDSAAGQVTNLDKSIFFSNCPVARRKLKGSSINGVPLRVLLNDVLLGQTLAVTIRTVDEAICRG